MVIIVEGNKSPKEGVSDEEIAAKLEEKIKEGLSSKDAIKEVSALTKTPKNVVYSIYVEKLSNR